MIRDRSWIAYLLGLKVFVSSAALQARQETLEITMPWDGMISIGETR